ncbi:MAG TPA: hypothetical protein VK936_02345 [Longimicrobiales bacterium]|nr:hypothetical protein [Longimicrobiales bacterium]
MAAARAPTILVFSIVAAGFTLLDHRDGAAQGVYGEFGGGAAVLEWQGATAVQPALQLSAGYQWPRALTVRLDARVIGTTNSALLGPGFGIGFAAPLAGIAHVHILGTAGTLLASEGTWTSSVGAVAGTGGAGKAALFGEVRLEHLTGDMTRAQRGNTVASVLAGLRIGSTGRAR